VNGTIGEQLLRRGIREEEVANGTEKTFGSAWKSKMPIANEPGGSGMRAGPGMGKGTEDEGRHGNARILKKGSEDRKLRSYRHCEHKCDIVVPFHRDGGWK